MAVHMVPTRGILDFDSFSSMSSELSMFELFLTMANPIACTLPIVRIPLYAYAYLQLAATATRTEKASS